ncbi:TRAP transporter large permease [Rhizobium sp. GR12]|uniref:TRAP transporter large permease n=1 Tax=Rhizobium sp. GR12 TaxID=3053925 RepID=UPI002FBE280A
MILDEHLSAPQGNLSLHWAGRAAMRLVSTFLLVVLGLMVLAIGWQIGTRYLFNAPSIITEEFLRFSLIWLGLVGAGYCFITGQHMNLPMLIEALPPRGQRFLQYLNAMICGLFGGVLVWGGLTSVLGNLATVTPMLQLSMGAMLSAIVVCGLMIVVTQAFEIVRLAKINQADWGLLAGSFLACVISCALIALLWRSEFMAQVVASNLELTSTVVLFVVSLVLLLIGLPISVALALAGVLTLGLQLDMSLVLPTVGETMFNGLDSFGFLALPFFILAGNIMNATGLAGRLIDLAMVIGGRIPGSLWHTNVLANMLFGTLSGSGIASASAIGGIITPVARQKGYNMAMTTAVNAASAPCGMLIPPSGALVVYSLITGGSASIIALFMAGYLPGIIMGLCVMIYAWWYARKNGYEVDEARPSGSEVLRIFIRAVPSLLLVVIVIAGILGGAFTAIEGSGVAVIYSLLLAVLYRGLTLERLRTILTESALVTGSILFLISCSTVMMWSMTFASIPETVGSLLTMVADNKFMVLLIINIVLLIVGIPMDMAPAMLIFTPIFFPVVTALGVDPVHFGIIMVYNLAMGIVTPPVGTVLFVACSISGERIGAVTRPLMPIFALQILGLLVITYVPEVTLWLPRLLGL